MARPISIDSQALLDHARAVFLEKGISATTAEIAARAGVSEGILFHRFGTKAELFGAALKPDVDEFLKELRLEERAGRTTIEAELDGLLRQLIGHLRNVVPCLMMAWSNRTDSGLPAALDVPNPPPLRVARALAGYFSAEMKLGRLRVCDPEVLGRMCGGAAFHYAFLETLDRTRGELSMPEDVFVHGFVEVLLRGAASPATSTPHKTSQKHRRPVTQTRVAQKARGKRAPAGHATAKAKKKD